MVGQRQNPSALVRSARRCRHADQQPGALSGCATPGCARESAWPGLRRSLTWCQECLAKLNEFVTSQSRRRAQRRTHTAGNLVELATSAAP